MSEGVREEVSASLPPPPLSLSISLSLLSLPQIFQRFQLTKEEEKMRKEQIAAQKLCVCVCACVRAGVNACVNACACVCVHAWGVFVQACVIAHAHACVVCKHYRCRTLFRCSSYIYMLS